MGFPIDFESKFGDHTGQLDSCVVWEQAPERETEMISLGQEWGITASWTTEGILAHIDDGKWKVQLRLESMGPGTELILPVANPLVVHNRTDGVWNGTKRTFTDKKITIPANTVTQPGPYKLVTIFQFYDYLDHPMPLVGFVEGPMLFFYEDHP